MTATHTPGPWYHVGGSDSRKAPFIRAEGDVLPGTMSIAQVNYRGSYSEHLANARLIAAAPDLLAALEMAYTMICAECADGAHTEQAQAALAAIAKATGNV